MPNFESFTTVQVDAERFKRLKAQQNEEILRRHLGLALYDRAKGWPGMVSTAVTSSTGTLTAVSQMPSGSSSA